MASENGLVLDEKLDEKNGSLHNITCRSRNN